MGVGESSIVGSIHMHLGNYPLERERMNYRIPPLIHPTSNSMQSKGY